MGRLENGFRKVAGRSQNGFSATFFQNVLQTLRTLSKKARINVLPKLFHNQIKTLSQRFHNVFCNVVPNRCHNVFTTFFVTLYQNVLQTLRKLSKKARINVLPKRFHNQIKTLSQRFHNVFFVSWGLANAMKNHTFASLTSGSGHLFKYVTYVTWHNE